MHAISFGARVLAGAAAVVFAGSMGVAAAANSKPHSTSFQLFPQTAEINCLKPSPAAPTPEVRVRLERHELNDSADIELRNFKPNLQGVTPERLDGQWLTSSWLQVETSIAFQMGLPVLILREAGVIADGVLEPDIIGDRTPEFSLDGEDVGRYLQRLEQTTAFRKWRQLVHNHARRTPQHSSLLDPN